MGGDVHNQNMPKQRPEPGGGCRRSKACASSGLTNPQAAAVVAGSRCHQVSRAMCFKKERVLKYFPPLTFLLSAISKSLWKGETGFRCWAL